MYTIAFPGLFWYNDRGSDEMSDKPFNQSEYIREYKATKIKRVPLDIQLSEYTNIKAAADRAGQGVNTYIKQAIRERMERET